MNWKHILALAIALFLAQVAIGFIEGGLYPKAGGLSSALAGAVTSFIVCGVLFAVFSARQSSKRYTHAWIALLIHVAAGLLLLLLIPSTRTSSPALLIVIQYGVLVCALIAGTALGSLRRHGVRTPPGT